MGRRTLYSVLVLATAFVMTAPLFSGNIVGDAGAAKPTTTYNLYFGDLHTHTSYSDAWEGTPWDAYAAAIAQGADFMATTDHVGVWNSYNGLALTDEEWQDTLRAAEYYTSSSFVAMPGYEAWLVANVGEINVYNIDELPTSEQTKNKFDRLPGLYDWISRHPGGVGQWNHPLYVSHDFMDYGYFSESRDGAMGMIEVYNDVNYEPSYIKALDAGWHVMPTANSDTHNPDWMSSEIRSVLLAPSLSAADLYEAMAAGRGYGTLDKNLEIQFTVDGMVMGSTLALVGPTCIASVHIVDPDRVATDAITLVEIVSDGGVVVASLSADSTVVDWSVDLDTSGAGYFWLRVTTASDLTGSAGVTAWTAPVWTGS